ncbi:MAG: MFS transporter [Alphaproteobacteria bacterium]|nr:MFS transporter [Alphaproteobacteria bacterium]
MNESGSKNLQAKNSRLNRGISYKKSWLIWGCAALFYCYQFMLRASPKVMAGDLMTAFQVDACTLGILTACYYNAYATLQVPAGSLMDYFKPRRVLTIAAIICSISTLLFSVADSVYVAAFGRTLMGIGSAMAFLSCLKLGTLWFPSHKLPLIVGLTVALGTVGGVSAGYPLAWLVDVYGWRHAMWLVAFIGFALAALGWMIVRDTPPQELEREVLKSHGDSEIHLPQMGLVTSIIEVIRKPQSWLIGAYGLLMYVPLSGFTDLWGIPYLLSAYQLDKQSAAIINDVVLIGLGLGSPLFSFLCNFLKAYKTTAFISALGALVFFSAILYIPGMPLWLLVICMFLAGLFLGGQFLAFAMTCALNPLSASATAGGVHNMICMLSGVIFMPLIGKLLDLVWQGGFENGVRSYTLSEYTFSLSSITVCLALACVVIFLIKEKYPRAEK